MTASFEFITHIPDGRTGRGDVHIAFENVDDVHFMATFFSRFHQTAGGIKTAITRQNSNFHIERTYVLATTKRGGSIIPREEMLED
jgi:hypothetical protein